MLQEKQSAGQGTTREGVKKPRLIGMLGPAFVAAIAYVDPGNVAANLSAGAEFGYMLLWVLVAANLMARVVQYLSAKIGLVTGKSLTANISDWFDSRRNPRRARTGRLLYWGQAEIIAAATDIAEVIGGAIALHLLFGGEERSVLIVQHGTEVFEVSPRHYCPHYQQEQRQKSSACLLHLFC